MNLSRAVNAGDELVVVDFFATWCGPCKMLGPVIERAADKFSDVHFYKVDIDEEMGPGSPLPGNECSHPYLL